MRPRGGLIPTPPRRSTIGATLIGVVLVAGACAPTSVSPSANPSASGQPSAVNSAGPSVGEVVPAPGSDSRIFAPNPQAIVVAIDPGHGGCLDWGVPNPYDNQVERSEKALTLAIAEALRDRLAADGVTVVMTRDADEALAGDLYPDLGCHGEPFRDVNGDGLAGFGPDLPEATRTRDELSARIDLANLARADVLLAIHINSFTENGVVLEIAGTETFWTDETSWGVPHAEGLATAVQGEVVAALDEIAAYERQDRGIDAVNYYVIAPPTTDDPRQPTRGILMPGVLAEVGSMSLSAEADLLATADGQAAIADGLFEALVAWFGRRDLGARLDAAVPGGAAGELPDVVPGSGPPYWAPELPADGSSATLTLTVTNTGLRAWDGGAEVLVGWLPSDDPYLARPPELASAGVVVPPLAPGEAVVLDLPLAALPVGDRAVMWVTLRVDDAALSERGLPALQLATDTPKS